MGHLIFILIFSLYTVCVSSILKPYIQKRSINWQCHQNHGCSTNHLRISSHTFRCSPETWKSRSLRIPPTFPKEYPILTPPEPQSWMDAKHGVFYWNPYFKILADYASALFQEILGMKKMMKTTQMSGIIWSKLGFSSQWQTLLGLTGWSTPWKHLGTHQARK